MKSDKKVQLPSYLVIMTLFLFSFMIGCTGTKSTINLTENKGDLEVFPINPEQADLIIHQAMSASAGANLAPLPAPTIGYRGSIHFGLDTHTFTAIAIAVDYDGQDGGRLRGYGFEVNHSGTFLLSGPARAGSIYKKIIQGAKAVSNPVKLTAKQVAEGKRTGPNLKLQPTAGGNSPKGFGSGFFITQDGYLVSNYHVVKSANRVVIRSKGTNFPATVVVTDESNDLAILKADGLFSCIGIRSSSEVRLGESVFTIGYPNPIDQGNAPKMTDGRISSLYGLRDDASQFQISVPIQPGNSGGPLVSDKGELIGVTVSTLNPSYALRRTGNLPQNVNFAVKSDYISILLKSVPSIKLPETPNSANKSKPFTDIVSDVTDATVMILVY